MAFFVILHISTFYRGFHIGIYWGPKPTRRALRVKMAPLALQLQCNMIQIDLDTLIFKEWYPEALAPQLI